MKIVFIGTVAFSKQCFLKLIELNYNIVGLITKANDGRNADYAGLVEIAEAHNIEYKLVRDINHENNIAWIRQRQPDVILCFGWSNLLKTEILGMTPLGVIGYHPALLPYNRGRHPLIWAKVLGLPYTGSTFFFMDEGADTGDILSQEKITIAFEDDAAALYRKMTEVALKQVEEFMPSLSDGTFTKIPQDKKEGNLWRKRGAKDGVIDFRMSSVAICNLVRALTVPYVGAHCNFEGTEVKVWACDLHEAGSPNDEPGKVLEVNNDQVVVKTGDGAVVLTKHEFNKMPSPDSYIM